MRKKMFLILVAVLMVAGGLFLLSVDQGPNVDMNLDGLSVVYAAAQPAAAPDYQTVSPVTPGIYCQSSYSADSRNACKNAGGVGMQARWFWCQMVDNNRTYDFTRLQNWVIANQQAGLRSVVAIVAKDLRTDTSALAGTGSCTAESDGTPSWVLTGIYNNDINGTTAAALNNPAGRPHLNYLDTQAKAEIRNMVQQLGQWLDNLEISNPTAYDSIEAIEVMFGEQDTGSGVLQSWYPYDDRAMYRCRYAGGSWTPNSAGTGAGTCSLTGTSVYWAAATNWRDNFSKPLLDTWGVIAPDKPKFMVVSNVFADAGIERSQACDGCNGKTLIDYAYDIYDIGSFSTGGGVDAFNGNGRDTAGQEYINWWNVFKLRWKDRLGGIEAGATSNYNVGATGCCDTSKELYWYGLQSIDYGLEYVQLTAAHLYNNRNTGALQSIRAYRADTVEQPDWRQSRAVGIWFRDTDGTYYPDGDNGTYGNPSVVRGPAPCCWHNPNYEWLLTQDNWASSQVVREASLPADDRSIWARRTNTSYPVFKFSINSEWDPATNPACTAFDVTVVYQDSGTDTWAFVYPAFGLPTGLAFGKTNTNTWKVKTISVTNWDMRFKISDGSSNPSSFYLQDNSDGVDTFHMVYIKNANPVFCSGSISSTPTPTPLSVCTVTPVPTRGVEVINTPTPTPTPAG